MRNLLIIGNWKMHGNWETSHALLHRLHESLNKFPNAIKIGVCPPFVYLERTHNFLSSHQSLIKLGAQDVSTEENGAYTGQISAAMLQDVGCEWVIVGHSERRHILNESSEQVAQKAMMALKSKLTPIICIGETLKERENSRTQQVLAEQLAPVLALGDNLSKIVVAYEPVWAIGTGLSATPEQAQEIHAWVREEVAKVDQNVAQSLPILYGGSVKPSNALELFGCPDVDGGLIGGASLDAGTFFEICKSAYNLAEDMPLPLE